MGRFPLAGPSHDTATKRDSGFAKQHHAVIERGSQVRCDSFIRSQSYSLTTDGITHNDKEAQQLQRAAVETTRTVKLYQGLLNTPSRENQGRCRPHYLGSSIKEKEKKTYHIHVVWYSRRMKSHHCKKRKRPKKEF